MPFRFRTALRWTVAGACWVIAMLVTSGSFAVDPPKRVPPKWLPPERDPVHEVAYPGRRATPYERAVADAYGTLLGFEYVSHQCLMTFPEYHAKNQAAYDDLREEQKDAIEDIRRHMKAMILRNAHGDAAMAAKVEKLSRDQTDADLQREMKTLGPGAVRENCRLYSKVVKVTFDFEKTLATQLKVLRSHVLAGKQ